MGSVPNPRRGHPPDHEGRVNDFSSPARRAARALRPGKAFHTYLVDAYELGRLGVACCGEEWPLSYYFKGSIGLEGCGAVSDKLISTSYTIIGPPCPSDSPSSRFLVSWIFDFRARGGAQGAAEGAAEDVTMMPELKEFLDLVRRDGARVEGLSVYGGFLRKLSGVVIALEKAHADLNI